MFKTNLGAVTAGRKLAPQAHETLAKAPGARYLEVCSS